MIAMVLSGLIVGMAAGWVLQRGRYCMNSAFRDLIFINDFTLFKAYILALVIAIVGANGLKDLGLIEQLRVQAFAPVANIVGGYIFGLGIVLAGGCGSGVWYRVGEGLFAAWIAVLGFMLGIFLTTQGLLKPVNDFLRGIYVWKTDSGLQALSAEEVADVPDALPLTLHNLIGVNKWIVIIALIVIALPFLLRGSIAKPKKGYAWPLAGLLIGLVIVAAWWASDLWGKGGRGVSYTGPTRELFNGIFFGTDFTWSAFLVLGTPLGAYLSARGLGEFKLKAPGAEEQLRVFVGGLIMGIGAIIGGGCNVGHGLTGVSTLAISSIVATIFIILGNWTMVYFLFIKPMKDLE